MDPREEGLCKDVNSGDNRSRESSVLKSTRSISKINNSADKSGSMLAKCF